MKSYGNKNNVRFQQRKKLLAPMSLVYRWKSRDIDTFWLKAKVVIVLSG